MKKNLFSCQTENFVEAHVNVFQVIYTVLYFDRVCYGVCDLMKHNACLACVLCGLGAVCTDRVSEDAPHMRGEDA